MKKSELKQIIKEEIVKILNEDTAVYRSKVDWYYIEEYSDYPGPKGKVVPYDEEVETGYDDPKGFEDEEGNIIPYKGTELYIAKGTQGYKKNNQFKDDEGNTVPFKEEYFTYKFSFPDDEDDDEFGHYNNPSQGWNIDDED